MQSRLQSLLNVRRGEWGLLIALFVLIALNTAAVEGANVVATSSYLAEQGVDSLPVLWSLDMGVVLITSALYALVADRFRRLDLVRGLLAGFGMAFLIIRLLLTYGLPGELIYTLLYILVDQLVILFPLAFWALANDFYNVSSSRRLFPLIAAGGMIGNVVGNWFAGISADIFARRNMTSDDLLLVCSLIFFAGVGVLFLIASRIDGSAPVRHANDRDHSPLRETWETGMEFVRNVPVFRYLALATFLNWLVIIMADYYFFYQTTLAFGEEDFQSFYGSFKAILTLVSLLVQVLIASRIMEKIGLKNMFFFLPLTLTLGSMVAAIRADLISAIGLRFGSRVMVDSLDDPAARSVQGLIPDARRGRVSTFLDSYVYASGAIVGCVIIGLFILLRQSGIVNSVAVIILYQGLATVIAEVTLYIAFRLRNSYDESLLNWRLRRKQRRAGAAHIELDL